MIMAVAGPTTGGSFRGKARVKAVTGKCKAIT